MHLITAGNRGDVGIRAVGHQTLGGDAAVLLSNAEVADPNEELELEEDE